MRVKLVLREISKNFKPSLFNIVRTRLYFWKRSFERNTKKITVFSFAVYKICNEEGEEESVTLYIRFKDKDRKYKAQFIVYIVSEKTLKKISRIIISHQYKRCVEKEFKRKEREIMQRNNSLKRIDRLFRRNFFLKKQNK
jgi:hypothetical protein